MNPLSCICDCANCKTGNHVRCYYEQALENRVETLTSISLDLYHALKRFVNTDNCGDHCSNHCPHCQGRRALDRADGRSWEDWTA